MSTLWQKPAEMRWEVTFASETRPLALSFAMGFFKGTGSAKVVCGKSNNSQKTLEKRLCSLLNQLSCRRPWAKGTSREDRFYSLGWQKSNFFGPKQHLVCFLKNQPGLCGHRLIRTKGIILIPESETLIVSLAFEPDTGYLRVVHEPAEAVKPETFHSFYLTFSPPGRVAMKAFYYNYKVNVTDKSIVVFQEKCLRGNFTALSTENSGRTAKPDWCHFENEIHVLAFSRFFFFLQ